MSRSLVIIRRQPYFNGFWKLCCQGMHNVFLWLSLNDHLNTHNLLQCKRFNIPTVECVICSSGAEETLKHLFFECQFAQLCWTSLHIIWNLSLPVLEMVVDGKTHFQYSCYMEVIMLETRAIWINWNKLHF
jgi:hypothetical protein